MHSKRFKSTYLEAKLNDKIESYKNNLISVLENFDWKPVYALATEFLNCMRLKKQIFICGNGGSGANAIHMANDFIYGTEKRLGYGIKCHALTSNSATITCLANDEGYNHIFSHQMNVLANDGDILLILSGSGNSENIIEAVKTSKSMGIKTYGILGFDGGKVKDLVDTAIHFDVEDMQISEDLQMVVANIILQWLYDLREET